MLKDFDYVEMKDYQSDMDDMRNMMLSAVDKFKREKEQAEMWLFAVINAIGKPVEVPEELLMNYEDLAITRSKNPENHCYILKPYRHDIETKDRGG